MACSLIWASLSSVDGCHMLWATRIRLSLRSAAVLGNGRLDYRSDLPSYRFSTSCLDSLVIRDHLRHVPRRNRPNGGYLGLESDRGI